MNRYYIEMNEDGRRIRCGKPEGYETGSQAQAAAENQVDDAGYPGNNVYVVCLIGYARITGDGGTTFILT